MAKNKLPPLAGRRRTRKPPPAHGVGTPEHAGEPTPPQAPDTAKVIALASMPRLADDDQAPTTWAPLRARGPRPAHQVDQDAGPAALVAVSDQETCLLVPRAPRLDRLVGTFPGAHYDADTTCWRIPGRPWRRQPRRWREILALAGEIVALADAIAADQLAQQAEADAREQARQARHDEAEERSRWRSLLVAEAVMPPLAQPVRLADTAYGACVVVFYDTGKDRMIDIGDDQVWGTHLSDYIGGAGRLLTYRLAAPADIAAAGVLDWSDRLSLPEGDIIEY